MSGWGGSRIGAGQKGAADLAPTAVAAADVFATPPEDLPEDQRAFWLTNAVLAIEKGTLTRHTASAFALLCEMDAERRATKATIDKDGRTYLKHSVDGAGVEHEELKAHPLTSHYRAMAKAVETGMKNFAIAPFGKAEPARAKAKTVNPWQEKVG